MKLFNTDGRQVQALKPIEGKQVKFYSCGPTVYDKPTIGNWLAFVRYDILARAVKANDYELRWIMNITDVGHLVSDADEGEDKLEKGAKRESTTAWQIAAKYTDYFLQGLGFFNISTPKENIVKATDFIEQQIDMIKTLEKKGLTYATNDGIYFDSSKFADYGKMARLDITGLQEGKRIEKGAKKHSTDFALWKFSPTDSKRDMEWDSPWGTGFPGWHLECSAIILSTLGETIDIHSGGIDHIPVHHTNEIAQSESATGRKFTNIWVHNNHLKINGQKISKSLNNGFTIEDLKQKGFSGQDFRWFVLSSNYRTEANFTWEILTEARAKRLQLQAAADLRWQSNMDNQTGKLNKFKEQILTALSDNLNTPKVIAILNEFSQSLSNGLIYEKADFNNFVTWLDETLGFNLAESTDISDAQKQLIKERNQARAERDWAKADELRLKLQEQNLAVKDIKNGSIWERLS